MPRHKHQLSDHFLPHHATFPFLEQGTRLVRTPVLARNNPCRCTVDTHRLLPHSYNMLVFLRWSRSTPVTQPNRYLDVKQVNSAFSTFQGNPSEGVF